MNATFYEFDDAHTAPIHGFKDADDYWKKCSLQAVDIRVAKRSEFHKFAVIPKRFIVERSLT